MALLGRHGCDRNRIGFTIHNLRHQKHGAKSTWCTRGRGRGQWWRNAKQGDLAMGHGDVMKILFPEPELFLSEPSSGAFCEQPAGRRAKYSCRKIVVRNRVVGNCAIVARKGGRGVEECASQQLASQKVLGGPRHRWGRCLVRERL